jgi:hypothetical protein
MALMVPNKEIREAFERSHMTAKEVARGCDWYKGKKRLPDDTRVKRALGLATVKNKGGYQFNHHVTEDTALKLVHAMGFDPVDFREIGL